MADPENHKTTNEDDKPAIMVGLTADELGANATPSKDLPINDGMQHLSAQDIKNVGDEINSIYSGGSNTEPDKITFNLALQGATGHLAGTIYDQLSKINLLEEQKKQREKDANFRVMAAMTEAELAKAYAQINEDLEEMGADVEIMQVNFEELAQNTNAILDKMHDERILLSDEVALYQSELTALQSIDTSDFDFNELSMHEAQIALKQAELDNAQARFNLIDGTIKDTEHKLAQTQQSLALSTEQLNALHMQAREAKEAGDGAALADIKERIALVESDIARSKQEVAEFEQRANITEAIANLTINTEDGHKSVIGKNFSCGIDAEAEFTKVQEINAKTDLIKTLASAASDGEITQAEIKNINDRMELASIDLDTRQRFISAVYDAGGTFLDENGQSIAQEELLTRWDELSKLEAETKQQMAETAKEIAETRENIAETAENLTKVDHEIATSQQDINAQTEEIKALESQLASLDADIAREKAELAQIEQNITSVEDALAKHGSIFGYMYDTHSVTDIVGLEVDESQLLKHDGNYVYMDSETQKLYTVSVDENGEQTQNFITDPVEDMALRAQVFEDGKYPSNFVSNAPVESNFDSYYATMGDSALGAAASKAKSWFGIDTDIGMTNEESNQIAMTALEDQKNYIAQFSRPALDEKIAQAEIQRKEITQKLESLKAEQGALEQKQEVLVVQEGRLTQEYNTKAITLDDIESEKSNIERLADKNNLEIPKHTPQELEHALNKVKTELDTAKHNGGYISEAQYEQLSQMPGMSPEIIDKMMSQNKIEVSQMVNPAFEASKKILEQNYNSYANSMDFAKYNDPNTPETNSFVALDDQPTPDENGSKPKIEDVQPKQPEILAAADAKNDEPKPTEQGMQPSMIG